MTGVRRAHLSQENLPVGRDRTAAEAFDASANLEAPKEQVLRIEQQIEDGPFLAHTDP